MVTIRIIARDPISGTVLEKTKEADTVFIAKHVLVMVPDTPLEYFVYIFSEGKLMNFFIPNSRRIN